MSTKTIFYYYFYGIVGLPDFTPPIIMRPVHHSTKSRSDLAYGSLKFLIFPVQWYQEAVILASTFNSCISRVVVMCNFSHGWLLRLFVSIHQQNFAIILPACITYICWSHHHTVFISRMYINKYLYIHIFVREFEKEYMYLCANFHWFKYFNWNQCHAKIAH